MPSVQRQDGDDPQALRSRDDGSIHRSERQVLISVNEFRDTEPITGWNWFNDEFARRQISEKADFGFRAQARAEEVADLGYHERRDDQRTRVPQ